MKKGLFQALTKAYKKYVVLFLALISSLFFVGVALAQEPQAPNEQDGKTITVRASVPLTPEFVFSIKKNSSVTLKKSAFALDEEINVRVTIMSGNSFPLRNHKINLQVVNNKKEALFVLFRETDNDGIAFFSFSVDESLLGKNILRVVDITYNEPIIISQERIFVVYKPSDSKREKELLGQILFDETQEFSASDIVLQNSDTIVADGSTEFQQTWYNDP